MNSYLIFPTCYSGRGRGLFVHFLGFSGALVLQFMVLCVVYAGRTGLPHGDKDSIQCSDWQLVVRVKMRASLQEMNVPSDGNVRVRACKEDSRINVYVRKKWDITITHINSRNPIPSYFFS